MQEMKSQKGVLFLDLVILAASFSVSLLVIELSLRVRDRYYFNQDEEWKPTSEFSLTHHHRLIPNVRSRHKGLEFDI